MSNQKNEININDLFTKIKDEGQKVDVFLTGLMGFYNDHRNSINYLIENSSSLNFVQQKEAGGGFSTKTNTETLEAQRFLNAHTLNAFKELKNIAESYGEYIAQKKLTDENAQQLYEFLLNEYTNIQDLMASDKKYLEEFIKNNNFSAILKEITDNIDLIKKNTEQDKIKDTTITEKNQLIDSYKDKLIKKETDLKNIRNLKHPYIIHNLGIKNLEQLGLYIYDNNILKEKSFESFEEIINRMNPFISKLDKEIAMKLYSREAFFNFMKSNSSTEYTDFSSEQDMKQYNSNKSITEFNEVTNWTDSSKCGVYGRGEFDKSKQMPSKIILSMNPQSKFERQDTAGGWKIMELWNYPEMLNPAGLFGGTFLNQMRYLKNNNVDFDPSSIKSLSFVYNNYSDGIGMMMIASTEQVNYEPNALKIGKGLIIL